MIIQLQTASELTGTCSEKFVRLLKTKNSRWLRLILTVFWIAALTFWLLTVLPNVQSLVWKCPMVEWLHKILIFQSSVVQFVQLDNLVQLGPIWSNLSKLVHLNSIWSNVFQFCPIWSNFVQFWQICPILSNFVQFCPIFSNSVQFCSNFVQFCSNFVQFGLNL